ncbi:MAG: hypothetical protein PHV68_07655 [Candidatus Gastranaerophilales bacterium]|nr:hypothetical protein [Candidatus Gastranaerophilales bacterium]
MNRTFIRAFNYNLINKNPISLLISFAKKIKKLFIEKTNKKISVSNDLKQQQEKFARAKCVFSQTANDQEKFFLNLTQ